jgi:hypothetical protein
MVELKVHSAERLLSAEDAGIARRLLDLLLARLPKEQEAAARLGGVDYLEARQVPIGKIAMVSRFDVIILLQGNELSLGEVDFPPWAIQGAADLLGLTQLVESTWDTISYSRRSP